MTAYGTDLASFLCHGKLYFNLDQVLYVECLIIMNL